MTAVNKLSIAAITSLHILGACSRVPEDRSESKAGTGGDQKVPTGVAETTPNPRVPVGPVFKTEVGAPKFVEPTLGVEPPDLSTDVAQTLPRVSVYETERTSAEVLDALASTVRLQTWPERGPVSASVGFERTSDPNGNSTSTHVLVRPAAPLVDRWYALAVGPLPKGVRWPAVSATITAKRRGSPPDKEERLVRFRPGSDPVIRHIRFCEDSQSGKYQIIAEFSERISATNGMQDTMEVRQAAPTKAACEVPDLPAGNDGTTLQLYSLCTGIVRSGTVTVSLPVGSFRTASGARPRDPSGKTDLTYSFVPDALADYGSGCRWLQL